MSRITRVGLEDRLLAVHYQTSRIGHGNETVAERNQLGLVTRRGWETCPDCRCTQPREPSGGRATPRVRTALRRLE